MNQRIPIFFAALLGSCTALAGDWPEIPVPGGARVEAIGEQVRLNGVPMRMHRVLSARPVKEMIGFYRQALGDHHAEQALPDGFLLSQARGDYFVTVRIKTLAAGLTEALVSASDARAAKHSASRPLGLSLPAESVVLSDMESIDAGKHSRQLVVSNRHAITVNQQSFARQLAERGMRPDGSPLRMSENEFVQFFKGDGREALLTLTRRDGLTSIVLTTIQNP